MVKLRHGAMDLNQERRRCAELHEISKIENHAAVRATARAALRARWIEEDAQHAAVRHIMVAVYTPCLWIRNRETQHVDRYLD